MCGVISQRFIFVHWRFSVCHFSARVSTCFLGLLLETFEGCIMLPSNLIIRIHQIWIPNRIWHLVTKRTHVRNTRYGGDIRHVDLRDRLVLNVWKVWITPMVKV